MGTTFSIEKCCLRYSFHSKRVAFAEVYIGNSSFHIFIYRNICVRNDFENKLLVCATISIVSNCVSNVFNLN